MPKMKAVKGLQVAPPGAARELLSVTEDREDWL
jgi:hypothetical protein